MRTYRVYMGNRSRIHHPLPSGGPGFSPLREALCGVYGKYTVLHPILLNKGTLLGTPNREPQEYRRYIMGIYLIFHYIPAIFLGFPIWGS